MHQYNLKTRRLSQKRVKEGKGSSLLDQVAPALSVRPEEASVCGGHETCAAVLTAAPSNATQTGTATGTGGTASPWVVGAAVRCADPVVPQG